MRPFGAGRRDPAGQPGQLRLPLGVTPEVRRRSSNAPTERSPGRTARSCSTASTYAGRHPLVVAIAEGEEAFVVTARDMTDAEKKTFRRKAR